MTLCYCTFWSNAQIRPRGRTRYRSGSSCDARKATAAWKTILPQANGGEDENQMGDENQMDRYWLRESSTAAVVARYPHVYMYLGTRRCSYYMWNRTFEGTRKNEHKEGCRMLYYHRFRFNRWLSREEADRALAGRHSARQRHCEPLRRLHRRRRVDSHRERVCGRRLHALQPLAERP